MALAMSGSSNRKASISHETSTSARSRVRRDGTELQVEAATLVPGDIVDIYATFPAADGLPARADLVLQAVKIVDIAPAVQRSDPDRGFAANEVVPVTFALDANDALVLAYAESFATQVRLGLRVPDATERIPDRDQRYQGGVG